MHFILCIDSHSNYLSVIPTMAQTTPAKGLIFDMDGVFADTEPLHFRAFQQVFNKLGIILSDEYLFHLVANRS